MRLSVQETRIKTHGSFRQKSKLKKLLVQKIFWKESRTKHQLTFTIICFSEVDILKNWRMPKYRHSFKIVRLFCWVSHYLLITYGGACSERSFQFNVSRKKKKCDVLAQELSSSSKGKLKSVSFQKQLIKSQCTVQIENISEEEQKVWTIRCRNDKLHVSSYYGKPAKPST